MEDRTRRRAQELGVLRPLPLSGFSLRRGVPPARVRRHVELLVARGWIESRGRVAGGLPYPSWPPRVRGNVEFRADGNAGRALLAGRLCAPGRTPPIRMRRENRSGLATRVKPVRSPRGRSTSRRRSAKPRGSSGCSERLPRRRPGQRRGPQASQESRSGPRVLFWADPDVRSLPPELETPARSCPLLPQRRCTWHGGPEAWELPSCALGDDPPLRPARPAPPTPPSSVGLQPDVVYLLPSSRSAAGSLDARLYPGGPRVRRFEDSPRRAGPPDSTRSRARVKPGLRPLAPETWRTCLRAGRLLLSIVQAGAASGDDGTSVSSTFLHAPRENCCGIRGPGSSATPAIQAHQTVIGGSWSVTAMIWPPALRASESASGQRGGSAPWRALRPAGWRRTAIPAIRRRIVGIVMPARWVRSSSAGSSFRRSTAPSPMGRLRRLESGRLLPMRDRGHERRHNGDPPGSRLLLLPDAQCIWSTALSNSTCAGRG